MSPRRPAIGCLGQRRRGCCQCRRDGLLREHYSVDDVLAALDERARGSRRSAFTTRVHDVAQVERQHRVDNFLATGDGCPQYTVDGTAGLRRSAPMMRLGYRRLQRQLHWPQRARGR